MRLSAYEYKLRPCPQGWRWLVTYMQVVSVATGTKRKREDARNAAREVILAALAKEGSGIVSTKAYRSSQIPN